MQQREALPQRSSIESCLFEWIGFYRVFLTLRGKRQDADKDDTLAIDIEEKGLRGASS